MTLTVLYAAFHGADLHRYMLCLPPSGCLSVIQSEQLVIEPVFQIGRIVPVTLHMIYAVVNLSSRKRIFMCLFPLHDRIHLYIVMKL